MLSLVFAIVACSRESAQRSRSVDGLGRQLKIGRPQRLGICIKDPE